MAVNVLRHCGYTIMAHPVPDEPLFRCRRDFFGKVLGGSEILRTFAVHCPKKTEEFTPTQNRCNRTP